MGLGDPIGMVAHSAGKEPAIQRRWHARLLRLLHLRRQPGRSERCRWKERRDRRVRQTFRAGIRAASDRHRAVSPHPDNTGAVQEAGNGRQLRKLIREIGVIGG
jgi:hypothetical protein